MDTMNAGIVAFDTDLGTCAVRWTAKGIASVRLPSARTDDLPVDPLLRYERRDVVRGRLLVALHRPESQRAVRVLPHEVGKAVAIEVAGRARRERRGDAGVAGHIYLARHQAPGARTTPTGESRTRIRNGRENDCGA